MVKIRESAEMYLETILILKKRSDTVRMIDVAEEMNFSRPSVSVFLRDLRDNGYIESDANGYISLTESGSAIAERIYERHRFLTQFLSSLGVSQETAAADACKMEHDISDETFLKMKEHFTKYTK